MSFSLLWEVVCISSLHLISDAVDEDYFHFRDERNKSEIESVADCYLSQDSNLGLLISS